MSTEQVTQGQLGGKKVQAVISSLGIIASVLALFWYDFISFVFNVPISREIILGVGMALCSAGYLMSVIRNETSELDTRTIAFLLVSVVGTSVQLVRGFTFKDITITIAPAIAALLVIRGRETLRIVLLVTMLTCVSLQLYETFTQTFVYVYRSSVGVLDEKEFLGFAGNFRAKGLFAGVLTTTSFLALNTLFSPSLPNWFGGILGASLGFGRNGQLFGVLAGISMVLGSKKMQRMLRRSSAYLVAAGFVAAVGFQVTAPEFVSKSMDRFLEAFNSQDTTNLSRMYMWSFGIELLSNHESASDVFFGIPNEPSRFNIMGLESSVLSIAVETGLFGIILYTVALSILIRRSFSARAYYMLPVILGLCIYVATVSMLKQLGNGVLFWCAVYCADEIITMFGRIDEGPYGQRPSEGTILVRR